MNPSKQNCCKAKDALDRLEASVPDKDSNDVLLVRQFLDAAERKLPNESSFPIPQSDPTEVQAAAEKGFKS